VTFHLPNIYFPKLYHRSLLGSLVALSLVLIAVQAQARTAPDSFADLAERLLPSVVNISTTQVIKGRNLPELTQAARRGLHSRYFFKVIF